MQGQITVLHIEDDVDVMELVGHILDRANIETVGAYGGEEGLKQIEAVRPDIVLLDLLMPNMDGWQVFQTMKATDTMREIPVIVLTAVARNVDRLLGLHVAGVNDYMTKPFRPHELLNSVKKVIADRSLTPDEGAPV